MRPEFLRIDPSLPVCWESTETLRFGFDRAETRLHLPSAAEQRMIVMLREGLDTSRLAAAGRKAGLAPAARKQLLDRLTPVLLRSPPASRAAAGAPPPPEQPPPRCAVLGEGWFADGLRRHLAACGVEVPETGAEAGFAVLVEHFLGSAEHAQPLLGDDIPHLLVRVSDRSVQLGPLVPPGGGPCLSCVELHGMREDPLAAALAAQIVGERPAAAAPRSLELCALLVRNALAAWRRGSPQLIGSRLRYAVHEGMPSPIPECERIAPHPECGCVGLAHLAAA